MSDKKSNALKRMFWVDLEMSGLDETKEKILEIAVIVTDLEFKEIETFHRIVYQPQSVLEGMDEWCKNTHGKSGLTALVPHGRPIEEVEDDVLKLVGKHFLPDEKVVLCGNSVGMDKKFIDVYMPRLAKKLHYRLVDVTSFKEIFRSKYKVQFQKKEGHRALDDIRESIAELKTYLAYVRVPAGS